MDALRSAVASLRDKVDGVKAPLAHPTPFADIHTAIPLPLIATSHRHVPRALPSEHRSISQRVSLPKIRAAPSPQSRTRDRRIDGLLRPST
jgi:hypothetical protein